MLKDQSEHVGEFDTMTFEGVFLDHSLERTVYRIYVLNNKNNGEHFFKNFSFNYFGYIYVLNSF